MNTTIDPIQISEKIAEKFKAAGWYHLVKGFFLSGGMETIIQKLVDEKEYGRSFTPNLRQVFRCFEITPYSDLKLVILNSEPYSYVQKTKEGSSVTVADGLAFSCSNTGRSQPSLAILQESIQESVYPGEEYSYPTDLAYLSEQGVLLLNVSLTASIGLLGKHQSIWKPFTTYLLDSLNSYNNIVYLFLGREAQQFGYLINKKTNYVFSENHPSYYARLKQPFPGEVFNEINKILKQTTNSEIKW